MTADLVEKMQITLESIDNTLKAIMNRMYQMDKKLDHLTTIVSSHSAHPEQRS